MAMEHGTPILDSQLVPVENMGESAFVFMGGIGYDEQRNREVGGAIIGLTGHRDVLTIPDAEAKGTRKGTAVYRGADGTERESPTKLPIKTIDGAEIRYTRLHKERAGKLIARIESAGSEPVDAVFQSVDVSTGLIAMHERPELFRKVVLIDPSSVIKLPSMRQYLKEEWQSGNLRDILNRRKDTSGFEKFEAPVSRREKFKRTRLSNRNGNRIASYISSQAPMLHDIAVAQNAPDISIIASRFDHAYTPQRLLQALVSLDDVNSFFITNFRHGLGGKRLRLEQLVSVFNGSEDRSKSFIDRIRFAEGVTDEYRKRIFNIIDSRQEK